MISKVKLGAAAAMLMATALVAGCGTGTGTGTAGPGPTPAKSSAAPARTVTATKQKSIQLPGKGGHGDVVAADPGAHMVYVSQSPDDNVVVIDTATNTIKAVIGNVSGGTGIAYDQDYVFVSAASADQVAIISKATWSVIATVPSGGKSPDAIYVDSRDHTIFVANVDSNNMEFFSESAPFKVLGNFPLQPANAKSDLGAYADKTNTIYQANDNSVVVIDAATRTIKKVISLPLPAGAAAKDMYYDAGSDVLWVGTSEKEILAINPTTGSVVANVATPSGMDQISSDDTGLLFIGESKAGVMGVVDTTTHKYLASIPTEADTHTLAYLPNSGLVYVYRNTSNVVDVVKIQAA
jgi:DNA-binding beta-propeller fold protein YncE